MNLVHSHQFAPGTQIAQLSQLLGTISCDRLQHWVQRLAFPRHFTAEPDRNRRTADLLVAELTRLAYRVHRQEPMGNVVALPPGPFREAILVGAHYDSVPNSPGADDNASALAALLVAAACCAQAPNPPVFVCFNREEEGFIGSADFVENHVKSAEFRIRHAHILEMLGYASTEPGSQHLPTGLPIQLPDRADFLGLLADDCAAEEMKRIVQLASTYTPELPTTGLQVVAGIERVFPVLARSDHVPFWRREIPALLWTDTAEFRNPHYHRPTDTWDTLNYTFLRNATRVLVATLMPFS